MHHTQESLFSSLAALLVLFTAMLSPMVSVILAASLLIGFGLFKYMQSNAKQSSKRIVSIVAGIIVLATLLSSLFLISVPAVLRSLRSNNSSSPVMPKPTPTVGEQLQDCLIRSDMKSKQTCDALLATIKDFEGCVSAGFPIQESYPPRCVLPNGKSFTGSTQGQVTLQGKETCLPHKNTKGPVTLECAIGLKTDGGLYYALDISVLQSQVQPGTQTGKLRVSGTLTPIEAVSSQQWETYDIRGIIRVTSLTPIP